MTELCVFTCSKWTWFFFSFVALFYVWFVVLCILFRLILCKLMTLRSSPHFFYFLCGVELTSMGVVISRCLHLLLVAHFLAKILSFPVLCYSLQSSRLRCIEKFPPTPLKLETWRLSIGAMREHFFKVP